jgi:predicted nucleotidyltransferase
MISVQDPFLKFKSRLELTQKEQDDASRRQQRIREVLRGQFKIERDILTGSYSRHTKTKPLKDVDIFCVLGKTEAHRRTGKPAALLEAFKAVLAKE